jgi:serine/threonine-protein kinase HipA
MTATPSCHVCGQGSAGGFHDGCLQDLFGAPLLPVIDVDLARLHTLALAMVGRVSVSGVQRKLSVALTADRSTLQLATTGGRYLLKPQAQTFPHLPENEWLTQRLAAMAGIEVPVAGLVPLRDGSLAYLVRRFDRSPDGRKLAMEDFCQLAELMPGQKYDSSAERCAALVRRYASEPLIELLRLYRQIVFAWWVGNGDLHLKNLALLRGADGRYRLSPAYDQLNTRLVIPGDSLALPVCGKRDNLKRETMRSLAERIGLGAKAADRARAEMAATLPAALDLVQAAPLPTEMRDSYSELLRERRSELD